MKKLALALLLAALTFMPAVAQADSIAVGDHVTITDVTLPFDYNSNGEVTGVGTGGTWFLNPVSPADFDPFMTFCIELGEHLSVDKGEEFVVSGIADYAVGGSGGAVGGKDDLSLETKALYHYFRTSSPAFFGSQLQLAFWALENEIAAPDDGVNAAYDWAIDNAGTYNFGNEFSVKALNLKY